MPCYAGGIDLDLALDKLLRQTEDNLAKGFRAIKMKVGRKRLAEDVEVALVEEISPDVPGLSAFDYLTADSNFDLGASGQITLGYLAACTQETIRGGHVTVGAAGSTVVGGQLSRRKVRCPAAVRPAAADSSQSGAMVFRAPLGAPTIGAIYPLITLTHPVGW